MPNRIAIIGATSAIAEHCARLWVATAAEIILVARDKTKADLIAADLRIRNSRTKIEVTTTDFTDPAQITKTVKAIVKGGTPNLVLIAHGSLPDQVRSQQDMTLASEALLINAVSPVLFAEAFASHMEKVDHGTIAIIGSVAGDRGRKSNYIYGAAKGLVTRYAEGLQHRLAFTNVKICLIKPGPVDTPMTAHLKQKGASLASVEAVAAQIVKNVAQGKRVIYTPRKWQLIMLVVSHLPFFIFKKMNV